MNKHLEAYRKGLDNAGLAEELVTVTVPSGYKFQMAKPTKYGMLFRLGNMPQAASSIAVEAWKAQGLLEADVTAEQVQNTEIAMTALNKVCELSRSPKIVVGDATSDDEFSTDWLADADTEHLVQWCVIAGAGGDESSIGLANFSKQSESGSLASASKRTVRKASKRAGGAA